MNRRQFLQLSAASGATALVPSLVSSLEGEGQAAPKSLGSKKQPALHFLVFGDWGSGAPLQKEVAAAMAKYCHAAKTPVAFAISTGDNFYDNGVVDNLDAQWETKFESMYPRHAMNFPFFAVLGNHDWRANPATQFSYRGPSGRWRMDGFYYRVSQRDGLADFFMVDTDLWLPQYHSEGLAAKQTKWLETALKQSSAKWKFLVGHHPPFTDGTHALEEDRMHVREIVTPLCKKYNVTTMLCGHDHDLQHIVAPEPGLDTHFVISGAAGATMRPRQTHEYKPFYRDMTGGFLAVELTHEAMKAQFIDSKGASLHQWVQL